MAEKRTQEGTETVAEVQPNGTPPLADGPVSAAPGQDALEAQMTLAHAEFVAAARIRQDMDGHLNMKMEAKLNRNVALAGARYVAALDAFEGVA